MPDWGVARVDATNVLAEQLIGGVTSSTANTKGAWQSSPPVPIPLESQVAGILVTSYSIVDATFLLDIGVVGVEGTSTFHPFINNILIASRSYHPSHMFIPIAPPMLDSSSSGGKEFRWAGRAQRGSSGATTIYSGIHVVGSGFGVSTPFTECVTMGANTATSRGVAIDPGTTLNTFGAWVEITSGVAGLPLRGLWARIGNQADYTRTLCTWIFEIGIGNAGEEVTILKQRLGCDSTPDIVSPEALGPWAITIEPNTRIAVRAQSSTTVAGDREFDIVLYGLR